MARHNAGIYGVERNIEFITGDFLEIAPTLKADVVFLSPPWGGPDYEKYKRFDMNTILEPIGGMVLYNIAARITQNVAYYLPKNADRFQVRFLYNNIQQSNYYVIIQYLAIIGLYIKIIHMCHSYYRLSVELRSLMQWDVFEIKELVYRQHAHIILANW